MVYYFILFWRVPHIFRQKTCFPVFEESHVSPTKLVNYFISIDFYTLPHTLNHHPGPVGPSGGRKEAMRGWKYHQKPLDIKCFRTANKHWNQFFFEAQESLSVFFTWFYFSFCTLFVTVSLLFISLSFLYFILFLYLYFICKGLPSLYFIHKNKASVKGLTWTRS